MISCFANVKAPFVLNEIDVYEFIEKIKIPSHTVLDLIIKARSYHGNRKDLYNKIKQQLPCFTLNFSFHSKKANANIKTSTGFIYLDLDNETDIDLTNELIFVSWKSLSNKGRGILVKVDGLTVSNFKRTYLSIAKELNIKVDKNANKPTQYCVQSYDKDVFLNNDSITWKCIDEVVNNTPKKDILHKRKRKDSAKKGVFFKLRFNNINDYDFKGNDYLYFEDEKENIAEVFIPRVILKGNRNNVISSIANQIKALNDNIDFDSFMRLIKAINFKHCKPHLEEVEVNHIINKTFKNKENILLLNKKKRFLFPPKSKLSQKEKMKIIAPILGERRRNKTIEEIQEVLNKWNVYKHGKVTQKSLQKLTGKNIKTIEKYYYLFKGLRDEINKEFKILYN